MPESVLAFESVLGLWPVWSDLKWRWKQDRKVSWSLIHIKARNFALKLLAFAFILLWVALENSVYLYTKLHIAVNIVQKKTKNK